MCIKSRMHLRNVQPPYTTLQAQFNFPVSLCVLRERLSLPGVSLLVFPGEGHLALQVVQLNAEKDKFLSKTNHLVPTDLES